MKNSYKGTVLITGASRGIGKACAYMMAKSGWRLQIVARNRQKLENVLADLPQNTHRLLSVDLVSQDGLRHLYDWLDDDLPDCVIHCLGGKVSDDNQKDVWQAMMVLNFHSIVSINEYLLPQFLDRQSGRIIHLSSSAALHGNAFTPYACAKAALNRYVASTGKETVLKNVIVSGLMPAAVEGNENEWAKAKVENNEKYQRMISGQVLKRAQTTEEIANVVKWLCEIPSPIFSGCILSSDGNNF